MYIGVYNTEEQHTEIAAAANATRCMNSQVAKAKDTTKIQHRKVYPVDCSLISSYLATSKPPVSGRLRKGSCVCSRYYFIGMQPCQVQIVCKTTCRYISADKLTFNGGKQAILSIHHMQLSRTCLLIYSNWLGYSQEYAHAHNCLHIQVRTSIFQPHLCT